MAVTEFRSELTVGTGFQDARTVTMIAADTSIAIWGPVVLASGAVNALPKAASTTNAGDALVFGVCVALPRSGTITANTSVIEVCVLGFCKVKSVSANHSLNDPLETSATAGRAQLQAQIVIDGSSLANLDTTTKNALNEFRKCFGVALTTVASGANSILLAKIGINHVQTVG